MTTTAWHITLASSLDQIEADGLVPMIGDRAALLGEPRPAIYLFPTLADLDTAMLQWLGEQFDEDEKLALLKVSLPEDADMWSDVEYEIVVGTPIPACDITVLSRDIDDVVDFDREFSEPSSPAPGF